MDELTINKFRYKNFKGIKDFTLEPCGKNFSVFGDNATGKTTLVDGFFWLLFGKDSQGKSDFQLKPVDQSGQEIHNLETEVEGILDHDGKTVTLMKRYQEKYTKKRGTAVSEFTGHETSYFIDEVPVSKKDYDIKIAEIIDINTFKLVANPFEFSLLHWTGRRQILLEMCGDVTDQDVIDSDKKLARLADILGETSIDNHKKKTKAKQAKINKELEQIPVRIAENQEVVKNATIPDQREKTRLDAALEEAQEKLRALMSNEALSAKRVRLNEIDSAVMKANNEANKKQTEARKPMQVVIDKLEAECREIKTGILDLEESNLRYGKRLEISSEAIQGIRDRWYTEDKKQLKGDDHCPTCGQHLPADQIQAAIESFNKAKSDRLEGITKEGTGLKALIQTLETDINNAEASIKTKTTALKSIEETLTARKKELEQVYIPLCLDNMDQEKDILETEIKALMNGSTIQEGTVQEKINEIKGSLDAWNLTAAEWKSAEKSRIRIEELTASERELAAEFERLESELFLIDQFIIRKVGMLEGKINSRFRLAKFILFETQINSGINECCHISYDGVKFDHGLNSAARVNVGLDIVNTLSEYYGFSCPVFVDNRESVNEVIPINSQVISLFVSKDKGLTVLETEAQKVS